MPLILKRISFSAGIISVLSGFFVILGYIIQNQTLKSVFSGFVAMNPATAMAFILGGVSTFLFNYKKTNNLFFKIGLFCAILVAAIGFVKLGSVIVGYDAYIDSYLFTEQLNLEAQTIGYVNRMAPNTAAAFLLTGIALLLLYKDKKERLAQLLSMGTFIIALLAILGYMYGVKNLIGFARYIPMALNTAVAFAVLSMGILCLRTTSGLMFLVTSKNAGGVVLRRLIPISILTPALVGYLGLMVEQKRIVTNELLLALVTVANIIIIAVFIWWIGNRLDYTDSKLKASYVMLEKKVTERTVELSLKKEKLAEDKARDEAVLSSIGDGLVTVDSEGKILMVNNAFEDLVGWTEEEVLGKLLSEVVEREDESGNIVPFKESILDKILFVDNTAVITGDWYYIRKDKTRFPAKGIVTPFILKGKTIGAVEVFHDITKEKEIDKAKTEFVSLASHQLRTPLTAINWYTEMILNGDVGKVMPYQKKYLEEIHQGNKRMIELVNTLLNVSRLELGKFNYHPELIVLKNVAENVLAELKPQILAQNITIDKNYDSLLSDIYTDPQMIIMIFQNLLGNAVKYVGANGKIILGISSLKSDILIKVWNNGSGIPKEAHPKIFTKLFRDDDAKQKVSDGNGLGLYIVKSIVENIGGKVWFESPTEKDGTGVAFYVTIPLDKVTKEMNII